MKTTRSFFILALAVCLGLQAAGKAGAGQQSAGELFEKALFVEEGRGDLQKAIGLYQDIVKRFPGDRETAAKALLHIGLCYEKLGKTEARNAYGRLLREYADQLQQVQQARSRLAQLEAAAGGQARTKEGLTFKKIDFQDAGGSHQARLSPDGTKMLYIGVQDKLPRFSIRMKDFNSGQIVLLVDDVNADVENLIFEWSPDGKKAVYTPKRGELRTVAIEGGRTEALWSAPDKDTAVYPLDWSNANQAILIALVNRADKTACLAVLPETGGQPRTVVSGDMSELADIAQFSPDGTSIVGMRKREKNTDVYVWAVDGSEEIRVTEHPAEDYYPLWSSDGRYIVFVSDRAKTVDLWAAPMEGRRTAGDPFRIQADIGKNKVPSDLTRGGQLLFYAVSSTGQPSDLFVLSVDPKTGNPSGGFRPFARYPTQATFIRWSPDGSRIAYTSRKGNIQLPNAYVSAGGTVEEIEIPAAGHWIGNVEWARDGKHLLFPGWEPDGGRVGIFRISLDDRKIEPLPPLGERYGTNFKGAYVNLRWLPLAGKFMVGRLLTDEEEVYLMDPGDNRLERLGEKIGISGYAIPSPDGRYLIGISTKDKSIRLTSMPDGSSRFLCPLSAEGWPAFSWSPDGKHVVWNEGDRLKMLSVENGSVRELAEAGVNKTFTNFHGGTPNTAWAPDGTKIAYALLDTAGGTGARGELWVVEPSGGAPRKIADAPAAHPQMTDVVWHPSGKSIFVQAHAPKDSRRSFEHWVMENFLGSGKK